MSGYSKTPLYKKLGFKDGQTVFIIHPPKEYSEFFDEFPVAPSFKKRPKEKSLDLIHWFVKSQSDLFNNFSRYRKLMKYDGMLWVSWPKGKSKIESDMKEAYIREVALPLGMVDVKVCAVDEDWSGLKLMYRRENRK